MQRNRPLPDGRAAGHHGQARVCARRCWIVNALAMYLQNPRPCPPLSSALDELGRNAGVSICRPDQRLPLTSVAPCQPHPVRRARTPLTPNIGAGACRRGRLSCSCGLANLTLVYNNCKLPKTRADGKLTTVGCGVHVVVSSRCAHLLTGGVGRRVPGKSELQSHHPRPRHLHVRLVNDRARWGANSLGRQLVFSFFLCYDSRSMHVNSS